MNGELSPEAAEFGAVVRNRLEQAGGIAVLRSAVVDPRVRVRAGEMLAEVGVWDLDPYAEQVQLEAAAAVVRAAGAFAFPYPVSERLAGGESGALALVVTGEGVVSHLDLPLAWRGVDLRGRGHSVRSLSAGPLGTRLAPFGVEAVAEPDGSADPRGAAVGLVLRSWWLLGLLETAHQETVRYAAEREQFGRPLARFQAIAFRIADGALAVRGLEELAKYTLWYLANERDDALALRDAIALWSAAQEATDVVLRHAIQVHGAMGLTDEVVVSWLARAAQATRRLPLDRQRVLGLLVDVMGPNGLGDLGRVGREAVEAATPASERVVP